MSKEATVLTVEDLVVLHRPYRRRQPRRVKRHLRRMVLHHDYLLPVERLAEYAELFCLQRHQEDFKRDCLSHLGLDEIPTPAGDPDPELGDGDAPGDALPQEPLERAEGDTPQATGEKGRKKSSKKAETATE